MEQVRIKIIGTVPLLMHRFSGDKDNKEAKRRDIQYDPVKEAEKSLYRNGRGCFVPAIWIEASLREAAKEFKGKGKSSLKSVILSAISVEPEEIPLNKETFDEIDSRPVVIQRNRIIRNRPRFNTWDLEFIINFDEEKISMETLKLLIEEAGAFKGIGDYRPKFGKFKIVSFE